MVAVCTQGAPADIYEATVDEATHLQCAWGAEAPPGQDVKRMCMPWQSADGAAAAKRSRRMHVLTPELRWWALFAFLTVKGGVVCLGRGRRAFEGSRMVVCVGVVVLQALQCEHKRQVLADAVD